MRRLAGIGASASPLLLPWLHPTITSETEKKTSLVGTRFQVPAFYYGVVVVFCCHTERANQVVLLSVLQIRNRRDIVISPLSFSIVLVYVLGLRSIRYSDFQLVTDLQ